MSATRVELTGTAQNKGLTLTKLVATPLGELRCHVAAAADAARYSRYNADVFTESFRQPGTSGVASCPHIWAAGAQPRRFQPNGCNRGDYFPVTAGTRRQRSSNVWPPISPIMCHTSPSMLHWSETFIPRSWLKGGPKPCVIDFV